MDSASSDVYAVWCTYTHEIYKNILWDKRCLFTYIWKGLFWHRTELVDGPKLATISIKVIANYDPAIVYKIFENYSIIPFRCQFRSMQLQYNRMRTTFYDSNIYHTLTVKIEEREKNVIWNISRATLERATLKRTRHYDK